jgi:hypothetical protein
MGRLGKREMGPSAGQGEKQGTRMLAGPRTPVRKAVLQVLEVGLRAQQVPNRQVQEQQVNLAVWQALEAQEARPPREARQVLEARQVREARKIRVAQGEQEARAALVPHQVLPAGRQNAAT